MKKRKIIMLKNEKLQKIRNNLRLLLLEWLNSELNKLFNEYKTTMSRDLLRKMQDLRRVGMKSICKCMTCGSSKKDMYYNQILQEWYCVDCFSINKEFYQKRMSGEGCLYDDFNEEYYKTFL